MKYFLSPSVEHFCEVVDFTTLYEKPQAYRYIMNIVSNTSYDELKTGDKDTLIRYKISKNKMNSEIQQKRSS